MSDDGIPVLWVCGPSGVGKTAVGWEIYSELLRSGVDAAFVDIDQLGMCYPEPQSDPGRYRMKGRNAGAVVENFRAAGARCVVISGVIDPVHGVPVEEFPNATLTVCWLAARPAEIRQRFLSRGTRLEEIEEAIRAAGDPSSLASVVVETSARSVDEVAAVVRQRAGSWPDLSRGTKTAVPATAATNSSADGRILWLFGPTGVGKSTVGFAVYQRVLRAGVTAGYVDVDQLGFCGHAGAGHRLKAESLAAVWRTYRDAGAEMLVAVGPIDDGSATKVYEEALPAATITWCRLHTGLDRLTERILLRGQGRGSWPEPGDRLRGRSSTELLEIARGSAAEAEGLERSAIGLRIDTDRRTVDEAAEAVLTMTRWHDRPMR